MQTFLPYHNFAESASVLDNKRLGKQRVENLQIMNALRSIKAGEKAAWINHPAVKMWVPNPAMLMAYHRYVVSEWVARGFEDTTLQKTYDIYVDIFKVSTLEEITQPLLFLGWEPFHASHRSNLLRKDPDHYGQFGWTEPDDLPYIWPTKVEELK